jgi:prepilin-type N-terminal cleavage/methylation domain-containing protein
VPRAARHRSRGAGWPGQLSGTQGFTLVELLVGMLIAVLVLTGVMSLMISGVNDQGLVEARTYQLEQGQAGMQQLVRALREATSVTLVSSSSITYSEPVATGTESVSFSCSTTTTDCTSTANGVQQTAITGVINGNVFTASPSASSPTYIGITLEISASKQTPVTLTDGAGLRNMTLGS